MLSFFFYKTDLNYLSVLIVIIRAFVKIISHFVSTPEYTYNPVHSKKYLSHYD